MKSKLLFVGLMGLLSCFYGCFFETTCKDDISCKCDLQCPTNYECFYDYFESDSPSDSDRMSCVMRNDISCLDDLDCPKESSCVNMICEELLCINQCGNDEDCVLFFDNEVRCYKK